MQTYLLCRIINNRSKHITPAGFKNFSGSWKSLVIAVYLH